MNISLQTFDDEKLPPRRISMLEQAVEEVHGREPNQTPTPKNNHDFTDFQSVDVEVLGEESKDFQGSISHRLDSAQGNQKNPTPTFEANRSKEESNKELETPKKITSAAAQN